MANDKWPTIDEAWQIVRQYTQNERLLLHAKAVGLLMAAFARKFGEDEARWEAVGILHDFDYEQNPTPETHVWAGTKILRGMGMDEALITLIASHADYTNTPRDTQASKVLYAVDELSGFLIACALIKPSKKLADVDVQSVKKRMKEKGFARAVDREAIMKGAEVLDVPLDEHIRFCLDSLLTHAPDLKI
jgi:putative nucleotidyltransferase with HDIG domain